jgi:DNA-binding PadR family transcriptional regulator
MEDEQTVDPLILGALEHGAASGRGLSRSAGPGAAVYRALRRLERDGLVRSSALRRSHGRQRLYRLTPAGAEAIAAWRLVLLGLAGGRKGRSIASDAWPSPRRSATSPT